MPPITPAESLPYPSANDVKLFANEYVNANTINRALLRLFYNDTYTANLESLNPVDLPAVANSLLVSTSATEYTWMNGDQVKTALSLTDSMFGLSDVDAQEVTIENNQGLVWNASSAAFISKDFVSSLTDLSDVVISNPINLQSLTYSTEYGIWLNAYPSDFSVGYIAQVVLEADGKVVLPAVSNVGQQVQITKYGTDTTAYIVPDASNKINGQDESLISNSPEASSSMHIRSILKSDGSIEWVTISGDGTWEFFDTALVPGSGIEIREVSSDDLMLAPYNVTIDNVPDATELTAGIIRIATYPEGIGGVANDVCVTPYQLKYYMDNYIIPFANDTEFALGSATDKTPSVAQIHSMENEFVAVTAGTHDLYKYNENNTWTYELDDFVGTDLDTDEIRGVYIETAGTTNNHEGYVKVSWPDGTERYICRLKATGSGDNVAAGGTTFIPLNKSNTEFTITLVFSSGVGLSFEIIGVTQKVYG